VFVRIPAPRLTYADRRGIYQGGIVIYYPRDWSATTAKDGAVVALAGPRQEDIRPAAAMVIGRSQGEMAALMNSAVQGLGPVADPHLLGEQQLSADRWARCYVRAQDAQATYVMVGIARGGGWIVTLVGNDLVRDPQLRLRARVLQHLLEALVMPR
jgi:hypothetical protein